MSNERYSQKAGDAYNKAVKSGDVENTEEACEAFLDQWHADNPSDTDDDEKKKDDRAQQRGESATPNLDAFIDRAKARVRPKGEK
ncbi:hypothetical protein MSG34_19460 [Vibrio sp. 1CM2L]|uniref:hypothetical protein n=1 Tax=Vibrio sp. 1CM2L TaxID=2929166 RepID=UPI0020C0ECB3|nr:hypothetical protein [Vibrio sp. 1CM2L]MCK8078341.1 hypothetical protein [Vibrio sp. 1CM2L]